MIIVKLIGGLGNQMFQYAAGRHLSFLHKTDLLIDISYLDKNPNGAYTKRNLELNVFNVDLKIASSADIKQFKIDSSTKYSRGFQRNFSFLFTNLYAAESGMAYNTQFLNFPKNTYLEGFWQSENYFKNIESILIKEFTPKEVLNLENSNWLNKILNTESVSLHIRRGDYVINNNTEGLHNILTIDYYKKAIDLIKSKNLNLDVFVFSDDLEWCKENLNLEHKTHFVDVNQKLNFHLDLFLMSNCKHNIIANSSFSWWAAWLNQHKNKMVFAPENWFADKTINIKDLLPIQWIKI